MKRIDSNKVWLNDKDPDATDYIQWTIWQYQGAEEGPPPLVPEYVLRIQAEIDSQRIAFWVELTDDGSDDGTFSSLTNLNSHLDFMLTRIAELTSVTPGN